MIITVIIIITRRMTIITGVAGDEGDATMIVTIVIIHSVLIMISSVP